MGFFYTEFLYIIGKAMTKIINMKNLKVTTPRKCY